MKRTYTVWVPIISNFRLGTFDASSEDAAIEMALSLPKSAWPDPRSVDDWEYGEPEAKEG